MLPELKVTFGGQDFILKWELDVSGDTVFVFTCVDVPGLTDVIMRKLPSVPKVFDSTVKLSQDALVALDAFTSNSGQKLREWSPFRQSLRQ